MSLPCAKETEQPHWRKASYCAGGECIETSFDNPGAVLVRDSKRPAGGNLALTSAQWRSLLSGIKSGQYDLLGR